MDVLRRLRGHREWDRVPEEYRARLDLSATHLLQARLFHASLDGANLSAADLGGAELEGANLEDANLIYAILEGPTS